MRELGIGELKRHVLLCRGPDCCALEKGNEVWEYSKRRLKELGLSDVYRSKVDCLRICKNGPIALVYPEGTWYDRVDQSKMERIIQTHLIGGQPLSEESFAVNPLAPL